MSAMPIATRIHNGKKQWSYRCYYTDHTGKRKQKNSKWFDTKKEATKAEAQFIEDAKSSSGTKLKNVIKDYIELHKSNNKPETIEDKEYILYTYLEPLLDVKVDRIKPAMIKQILESDDIQKLSTARKNKIYIYFKGVFEHACNFYDLLRNPMRSIPSFKMTEKERLHEMTIYTPDQFQTFCDAIPEAKREFMIFFHLLFWTGLRKNEAMSLTFNDYDGKRVNIWRQLKRSSHSEFTVLKSPTSKRTVSLDKVTIKLLNEQLDKYKGMPGYSTDWFLFGGYKPLSLTSIDRIKKAAIEKSGLPYIRIHDFRHSHASYLIDKGVNMYKISKRLGHSSITITMDRYGHLLDRQEDEILDAIENG